MVEESKRYPVELNFQSELSLYGTSEYVSFCCYEMELTIPAGTKHDGSQWRDVAKWMFDYSIWLDKYWSQGCVEPMRFQFGKGRRRRCELSAAKDIDSSDVLLIEVDEPCTALLDVDAAKQMIGWLSQFVAFAETKKTP